MEAKVKTHSRWLREGMFPVWKVECLKCQRVYRVSEFQSFLCDCQKSTIVADQSVIQEEDGQVVPA